MVQTKEAVGYSAVSTLLWREREALQLLLFKLVEEQLILQAGQTRLLPDANQEIEFAVDQLRCTEVLRAAEVDAIAQQLEVAELPTLAEFSEVAPEPWATVFTEHRESLRQLVDEVETATGTNRALLVAGARSQRVRATQTAAVPNTIALKSQLSDLQDIDLANTMVDMTTADTAYQSALATTAKIRQISLVDYLR
jgi:Flagellin and related hook-associated proteins